MLSVQMYKMPSINVLHNYLIVLYDFQVFTSLLQSGLKYSSIIFHKLHSFKNFRIFNIFIAQFPFYLAD